MLLNNHYYYFYSNCVLTYGNKESVIIDLFRYRYQKIPASMLRILEKYEKIRFDVIRKNLQTDELKVFKSIIKKLYEQDYIGVSDFKNKNSWIKWNGTNRLAHRTTIAEINYSSQSSYSLSDTIKKLALAGIDSIFFYVNHKKILNIINDISQACIGTSITYIAIIYDGDILIDTNLENAINQNKRFSDIYAKKIAIKTIKKLRWCNFHVTDPKSRNIRFFVDPRLYTELLQGKSKNKLYISQNGIVTKNF